MKKIVYLGVIFFFLVFTIQIAYLESFFLQSFRFLNKQVSLHKKCDHSIFSTFSSINLIEEPLKIACNRIIQPGDYVIHLTFGIGKYIGTRNVSISKKSNSTVKAVKLKYADSEIDIYQRFAEQELWLYRLAGYGDHDLSYIYNPRKWKDLYLTVCKRNRVLAVNIVALMAIRNSIFRHPYPPDNEEFKRFTNSFHHELTPDQIKCNEDISRDMINSSRPMDRLICGDVGFGKTEVAIRAIYRVVLAKKQALLLAPTRILASQHYKTISERLPHLNISLILGSSSKAQLGKIHKNSNIIIGTHSLFENHIHTKNLGILIIDEEQRFGVEQKEKLKMGFAGIDVLSMSATPIPRTLQMGLSGLKDLSLINTPPLGRKEVKTIIKPLDYQIIRKAIEYELERHGQTFVVVPHIQDIEEVASELGKFLPKSELSIIHGRIPQYEETLEPFINNKTKVLLATTVIENGIHIPSVNSIIVLNATRFGVSTLYQLKGRVGRNDQNAFAYFLYNKHDLSPTALTRLKSLEKFSGLGSGYDLARVDMDMRGFGTFYGVEQSGQRDLGVDFQTNILVKTIEKLKENDFFVYVRESRLGLHDLIEARAQEMKLEMPPISKPSEITKVEYLLAENIFKTHFSDIQIKENQDHQHAINACAFFGLQNIEHLRNITLIWQDIFHGKIPNELIAYHKRHMIRTLARKIGLVELARIKPNENIFLLRFEQLNERKWCKYNNSLPNIYQSTLSLLNHPVAGFLVRYQPNEHLKVNNQGNIINDGLDALIQLLDEINHMNTNIMNVLLLNNGVKKRSKKDSNGSEDEELLDYFLFEQDSSN